MSRQEQSPAGYYWPEPVRPRKRRHVFRWIFLAIQVVFLIILIAGLASHSPGPTAAAQAAHQCAHHGWFPLFKSQHDCDVHYAIGLNDAADTGKGIGVALVVILWCVADFLVGVPYVIWRLASRGRGEHQ